MEPLLDPPREPLTPAQLRDHLFLLAVADRDDFLDTAEWCLRRAYGSPAVAAS